jgi:predicted GIY-YIG superfamily endonuclease
LLQQANEYRKQIEKLERRGAPEWELSTARINYQINKAAADRVHAVKHTLPPTYLNGTTARRNGKYGSIYLIYNEAECTGYVGMTDHEVEERLLHHAMGVGGKFIGKAFERLPKETFYLYVLEQCADLDDLSERERYWIEFLGTYRQGYNGNTGGRGGFKSRLARAERDFEERKRRANIKLVQLRSLPRSAPQYRREEILREYRGWQDAADRLEAEIKMLKVQRSQ